MKYCQFCGAKLEDGALCTCPDAQAAAQQQSAAQQAAEAAAAKQAAEAAAAKQAAAAQEAAAAAQAAAAVAQEKAKAATKRMGGYLLSYLAAPAQTVRGYMTREGFSLGILLTVIRVLAAGLATFGLLSNVCRSIVSFLDTDKLKIAAPFFGSMLYGGLIAVIGTALFILGFFAIAKLQKSQLSLTAAWQTSALNSILPTLLLLAAFLASFVSFSAALALLALSVIASLVCGVLTAQFSCERTNSGLFWVLFLIVIAIIALVCWKVVPSLVMNAIGGIKLTYGRESMTLAEIMEQANTALDPKEIWDSILESLLSDLSYIRRSLF